MKVTIKGKEYTTNFGMGFVRKVNLATATVVDGRSFSTGLVEYLTKYYQLADLTAFADLLHFSLWKEQNAITANDVDEFCDELDSKGELETFVNDFMEELTACTVGKKAKEQMEYNIRQQKKMK